jgi:hypothetical protein
MAKDIVAVDNFTSRSLAGLEGTARLRLRLRLNTALPN